VSSIPTSNYEDHWTTYAACSGVDDAEIFFPLVYDQAAVFQIAEAKKVCGRCVSREQCLSWALRAGEPDGIWGGTTPDERRHLRRRLGIQSTKRRRPVPSEAPAA
jgi:WhiB family redox-sensing transcriptional regulator